MNFPLFDKNFSEFDHVIIFLSCQRLCFGIYDGMERAVPGGLWFFSTILLFWLIANWIIEDVKNTGVTWVSDSRFALLIAWTVLIPIYLFQTRKIKALKVISCFIAFWVFFRTLGIIAGKFLSV